MASSVSIITLFWLWRILAVNLPLTCHYHTGFTSSWFSRFKWSGSICRFLLGVWPDWETVCESIIDALHIHYRCKALAVSLPLCVWSPGVFILRFHKFFVAPSRRVHACVCTHTQACVCVWDSPSCVAGQNHQQALSLPLTAMASSESGREERGKMWG